MTSIWSLAKVVKGRMIIAINYQIIIIAVFYPSGMKTGAKKEIESLT